MSQSIRICLAALGLLALSSCQRTPPIVDDSEAPATSAPAMSAGGSPASSMKAASGNPKDTTVAKAIADIAPFGEGQITGTYEFTQTADGGVTGTVKVRNCVEDGKALHAYIRQGHSCASSADIGGRWSKDDDGASGPCNAGGTTFALAIHIAQPSLPSDWSIGGSAETNIVGRAVVVSMDNELVDDPKVIGCGVIRRTL